MGEGQNKAKMDRFYRIVGRSGGCRRNGERAKKQIPCGNDRKKNKNKDKNNDKGKDGWFCGSPV